jgi:CxxC motif-containing protein (DUF1111 family)
MKVSLLLNTRSFVLLAVAVACSNAFAQSETPRPSHRSLRQPPATASAVSLTSRPDFGDPLPGLTEEQLEAFAEGAEEFEHEDTAESGLGPVFNNVSCVACHSVPAIGGASEIVETRFGRFANGRFDPLAEKGGSLLQDKAIDPSILEKIPAKANVVAKRLTTPLFGLGLMEAIPDATILKNTFTRKPDGISGVPSVVRDVATGKLRVGRFGWKAQQATILAFSGDAYLNEVGITSRLFPDENPPNGDTNLLAIFDLNEDPEDEVEEDGRSDIDFFADFMRFLGPPPQLPLNASGRAGEKIFSQLGCALCHQPTMTTGPNEIAALDRKTVPLFSDLLLHDMGSLGDGIAQGTARPREMRTAPLWGLRGRTLFLHDGRATTVDQAIRAHAGEGQRARDRYVRLSPAQKRNLWDFLNSN